MTARLQLSLVIRTTETSASWRKVGADQQRIGIVRNVQEKNIGGRPRQILSSADITNISWTAWQECKGSMDGAWAPPTRKSSGAHRGLMGIAASARSPVRLLKITSSMQGLDLPHRHCTRQIRKPLIRQLPMRKPSGRLPRSQIRLSHQKKQTSCATSPKHRKTLGIA